MIVPGTGIHLNNMMGEEDLSPLGFFTHPPGRRLPSMMAPTVVARDGEVMLALGSAGSNRIRSAILQVILGVIDRGLDLRAAVEAPRVHWEDGVVYAEPGAEAERSPPRAGSSRTSPTSTCSSAAPRRSAATPPPASWPARATRAAAARSSRPEGQRSDGGGLVADSRTTSSVGSTTSAGVRALDRLEQHAPGGAALLHERLAHGGEAARRGGGDVVEADDREVVEERRAPRRWRRRSPRARSRRTCRARRSAAARARAARRPPRAPSVARVQVDLVDRDRRRSERPAPASASS